MGGVAERAALAAFAACASASTSIANLAGSLKVLDVTGSTLLLSLTVLAYNVSFTLMSWFWPSLFAGRLSRRALLAISSTGLGLGLLLMASSSNYWLIITGSGVAGAFAALNYPVMVTVMTDYYGRDSTAVTKYNTYSGIGFIAGYVVAAAAREFMGTSLILAIASATSICVSPLTALMPRKYVAVEPRRVSYVSIIPQLTGRLRPVPSLILTPKVVYNLSRLLSDLSRMVRARMRRKLPLTMVATATLFTAISLFFTPLPAALRFYGLSDSEVYLTYTVSSITSIALYGFMRRLIDRCEDAWRLLISATITRSPIFLLPMYLSLINDLTTRLSVITACFILIGATWAAISSSLTAVVLAMSERERREERLGHLNAVIGLGTIIGSLISGPLTQGLGWFAESLTASLLVITSSLTYYKAMKALVT